MSEESEEFKEVLTPKLTTTSSNSYGSVTCIAWHQTKEWVRNISIFRENCIYSADQFNTCIFTSYLNNVALFCKSFGLFRENCIILSRSNPCMLASYETKRDIILQIIWFGLKCKGSETIYNVCISCWNVMKLLS